MEPLKLSRTELAFLHLTPPKTLFRAPPFSHLRMVISPELPSPPPEPPDPPDPSVLGSSFRPLLLSLSVPLKLLYPLPLFTSCAGPPPDPPWDQRVLLWSVVASCVFIRNAGGPGVSSLSPVLHSTAAPLPRSSETMVWAWPKMILLGFCLSFLFGLGPLVVMTVHDIFVLKSHDYARDSDAELFSSPIFLEMFNFSLSSFRRERPISPSFLHGERIFPQSLLSLRGGIFSVSIPSKLYNILTVLSSCVAVSTGPEDATGFVLSIFRGRSWCLTSQSNVTRLQQSGLAVMSLRTHLNFASNSLSYEDLSILISCFLVWYCSDQRGCLIPSSYCSFPV